MDLYKKIQNRTYIIAEMSANHAGEKNRARELIYAAKEAGADCVKIQTYTADSLTIDCDNEYFQIKKGTWENENLYRLYQRAYTPWEWQGELKELADQIGIDFLSTPFDRSSVDFLEEIGMEFYKIASFELVDLPLIRYVASKGKPMIVSTGMGTLGDIEDAIMVMREAGCPQIVLLKCSSAYPAIPTDMNLRTMANMAETFGVPTGLSDHSLGSVGAIVAVAMGARVIEKHFCISREIENPDSSFSMEEEEFAQMVRDIRMAERAVGCVQYGPSKSEEDSLAFRRSIFVTRDVEAGEKLTEENIRIIRPGYGLSPKFYEDILGQRALCRMERGTPLRLDMVGRIEEA